MATEDPYMAAYWREKKARARAEALLEDKTRELYYANQELERNYTELALSHEQLKLAQQHLLQSEKLSMLANLAAGIAHEINNPIGYMISNLTTLGEYNAVLRQNLDLYKATVAKITPSMIPAIDEQLEQIDQLRQQEDIDFILSDLDALVNESISGGHRIKDIVNCLEIFCELDRYELSEIDPKPICESVFAEFVERSCVDSSKGGCGGGLNGEGGDKQRHYFQQIGIECRIIGNAYVLEQIVNNLLENARFATKWVGHKDKSEGNIWFSLVDEGNTLKIEVRDDGMGIEDINVHRIFNPFFTTKPVGSGTGLGLTLVSSMVKQMAGSVSVSSRPNEGATFAIRVPKVVG